MLLTFSKPKFESLIKDEVKIHTIRADKSNRWKVGTKIHFWLGNPRNTRGKNKPYQFGLGEVSRIESIIINTHTDTIYIGEAKFKSKVELDAIAKNDGFDSWQEMKCFFIGDFGYFVGKIIFWKNCTWL